MKRTYYKTIWKEFNDEKHMVFISGPRQTGKTTLARDIAVECDSSLYFNYDIPKNKAIVQTNPLFFEQVDRRNSEDIPLIIFDELHKFKDWKEYLKGVYDGYHERFNFLITGSGRLNLYQKRGESLAGRFLHFHMFPFTLGELYSESITTSLVDRIPDSLMPQEGTQEMYDLWDTFFHISSFPEPFTRGKKISYRRWARSYHDQVIRNDLRDAYMARKIDVIETLYELLIPRIGGLLSANSLAQQLRVSHTSIREWLSLFEHLNLVFKLRPFSRKISRSILKEPKYYFFETGRVEDHGKRFENLIALELNRAVTLWTDYGLGRYELRFIRNKEQQEVDFLILKNNHPVLLVESKLSDLNVSKALIKFQSMLSIPAVQLVNKRNVQRIIKNGDQEIVVTSAAPWLAQLG